MNVIIDANGENTVTLKALARGTDIVAGEDERVCEGSEGKNEPESQVWDHIHDRRLL